MALIVIFIRTVPGPHVAYVSSILYSESSSKTHTSLPCAVSDLRVAPVRSFQTLSALLHARLLGCVRIGDDFRFRVGFWLLNLWLFNLRLFNLWLRFLLRCLNIFLRKFYGRDRFFYDGDLWFGFLLRCLNVRFRKFDSRDGLFYHRYLWFGHRCFSCLGCRCLRCSGGYILLWHSKGTNGHKENEKQHACHGEAAVVCKRSRGEARLRVTFTFSGEI